MKKNHKIPDHVAIIMDGNGRWAKKLGRKRVFGHENGTNSVRECLEGAVELGVKYVTLYVFSKENWKRPKFEVDTLMKLLISSLQIEFTTLIKNDIKLLAIGDLDELNLDSKKKLNDVILKTSQNNKLVLTLAISYGSKQELTEVVKNISDKVKNNIISKENIDEKIINQHLYTRNLPNVDLLIRTGGEFRISNFLLWQIAYAELYFSKKLWPDFGKEDFFNAIESYKKRERRFGKVIDHS